MENNSESQPTESQIKGNSPFSWKVGLPAVIAIAVVTMLLFGVYMWLYPSVSPTTVLEEDAPYTPEEKGVLLERLEQSSKEQESLLSEEEKMRILEELSAENKEANSQAGVPIE